MTLLIVYYALVLLVILASFLSRSYLLSVYFSAVFFCDFAGWLRQHFTSYPKPYEGVGFAMFAVTTALYLAIPLVTVLTAVYSFTKKIAIGPIVMWLVASFGLLSMYPDLRGQSMLNAFYAYYLTSMIALLVYILSKAKSKFTFTQGALLLATLGSISTTVLAITQVTIDNVTLQLHSWDLITLCNCICYTGLLVCSVLNRFLKRLLP